MAGVHFLSLTKLEHRLRTSVLYIKLRLLLDEFPIRVHHFQMCRTYELKVHGGTPFESGMEVDPALGLTGAHP